MAMKSILRTSIAIVGVAAFGHVSAIAAESAELQALDAKVAALQKQVAELVHEIEVLRAAEAKGAGTSVAATKPAAAAATETKAATPAPAEVSPKIIMNERGLTFASADGANSVRFGGRIQFDGRQYVDNGVAADGFVLRRARLFVDGTLSKIYSFELQTEFSGASASVLDADVAVTLSPALKLKMGRYKVPFGLEQLQSDWWTFMNERSLASNLTPVRDLGVQASGKVAGGAVNYAVGIFNGVADGANTTNADFDSAKELYGRFMFTPFNGSDDSLLKGLAFGVAGSSGREETAAGRTAGYRTDGQQLFFAYNAAVVADGQTWRVSPQFEYRHGPVGAIGEYVVSTVNLRPAAGAPKAELTNRAWQLVAGYVLTGEDSSSDGVRPRANFNAAAGTWGAFEITGRYANLRIDDATFPLFASPASNANEASSFGFGLNWYLSKVTAFKIDYFQTNFGFNSSLSGPSANPILRQDEKVIISRFQFTF